ncbi:hypothetical protein Q8F55_004179 [Vanrija albida]|uniref:Septum formation protein Maf n=1 Tax=Vanrija albida TaxID=181172 RepID=A0ABR3Q611_9TREE
MSVVTKRPSPVLPTAMPWPIFERLKNKRVVLASSSPRRKDILANVVSVRAMKPAHTQGFQPEIVPSTFDEDLPKAMFEDRLADYPVATAGEKVA